MPAPEPLRLTIVTDRIAALRARQDALEIERLATRPPDVPDTPVVPDTPDTER